MKKLFFIFLIIILSANLSISKNVNIKKAKTIATNIFYNRSGLDLNKINLKLEYVKINNNDTLYYVFSNNGKGFIILSADDATMPLIGYSVENNFKSDYAQDNFGFFLQTYEKQIKYVKTNKAVGDSRINNEWAKYAVPTKSTNAQTTLQPLLMVTWNQDSPYNAACPVDANGPGGHVYVGCVALSMGQVIKYWNYPNVGYGSHTNYSVLNGGYGNLTVNYANENFVWTNMPLKLLSENNDVATLLYDCSVAVDMHYSANGSGSTTDRTVDALDTYFKYDNSINIKNRSNYSDVDWKNILKQEIDVKRPMIYSGMDSNVHKGHAWNCDGYNSSDEFHMNWGWGGYNNGYFNLDDFTSTGYNFDSQFQAVVSIYPPTSVYPEGCSSSPKLITGKEGSFTDGSGNGNYSDNNDCEWLIQPACGTSVQLSFDRWLIETNDSVIIYDGSTTSDNVLARYGGDDNPSSYVTSTGNSMLVRFITDGSGNDFGFVASYKVITCSGSKTITDASGTINDGSGSCDYENSKICKWYIEPAGVGTFNLNFTEFDLSTANTYDYVQIFKDVYDVAHLVDRYDYTNVPTNLTIAASKLIINFKTNSTDVSGGWTFTYTTSTDVNENPIISKLKIYPNPYKNDATIEYNLLKNSDVNISVTNILGNILGQNNSYQTEGTHSINLSQIANNLSKGIFFVNVTVDNKVYNYKIIKSE